MKIEFRTDEPPKDKTEIIGIFGHNSKYYVETVFFKDGVWVIKYNYPSHCSEDPIYWIELEEITSEIVNKEKRYKLNRQAETINEIVGALDQMSSQKLKSLINSDEEIRQKTVLFFKALETKILENLGDLQNEN
jgi:hypothetical protein